MAGWEHILPSNIRTDIPSRKVHFRRCTLRRPRDHRHCQHVSSSLAILIFYAPARQ